jgi:hypothetical protein
MKYLSIPLGVLLLGLSTSGQAMTYDFAAEGNLHEAGYSTFNSADHSAINHGGAPDMPGGLSITASNGGLTGDVGLTNNINGDANTLDYVGYYAYMDAKSNNPAGVPEDGGLGVCKEATGNCAGIADDNQTDGEFIHMVFDEVVNILSLNITGDHTAVNDGAELWYSLDGGSMWYETDIGGFHGMDLITATLTGSMDPDNWITKTLDYTIVHGLQQPDAQMYLSSITVVSAVPLPAAVWLFGTALIGVVGFGKRRREAQI